MSKKAMCSKTVIAQEEGEKLLQEKEEISAKVENVVSAKKLAGRAEKISSKPPKQEEKEWQEGLAVRFEKLSLKFTKEFFALFEVSFDAYQGEKIAILGENECGKTSILRIIAYLETPCSGTVKIFDRKPTQKLFQREVMLGFLPENPVMLSKKTAIENMVYAKRIREKKTQTDCDVASGILFDLGLIDIKNKVVNELSYFQKQCLAIARLKFRPMDIILIDGIFDKLSEEETKVILELIEKVKNDKTLIIFTTTDIVLAKKLSTRVIKIENGSLSEN